MSSRVHAGSLLALLLLTGTPASAQRSPAAAVPKYVVVVNAANPVVGIDRDQLSGIFLKRVARWPGGARVDPVDLAVGLPSRVAFSQSVHKKAVGAIRAFWQQQIFSGRDVPPAEKRSEAELVSYVKDNPTAVGYVSGGMELITGVKTIEVYGAKP